MVATLGSLTTQILEDANRDPSGLISTNSSDTYTTAVNRAVTAAIIYCEPLFFWLFKKSGTIFINGTSDTPLNSVPFPDDYMALLSVQMLYCGSYYSQNQGFVEVTFDQLISRYYTPTDTGTPIWFAQYADVFYIYPNTTSTTQFNIFYYYKDVTYPVNPGDTSIWFGALTYDLIRVYAMYRFYLDTLQAPEIATNYLQDFQGLEARLRTRNASKSVYYTLRS